MTRTSDLLRAALASSKSCSLSDRISSVVAALLPNRVIYWALVRVASIDGMRLGLGSTQMAQQPIGVVAARLRCEILRDDVGLN